MTSFNSVGSVDRTVTANSATRYLHMRHRQFSLTLRCEICVRSAATAHYVLELCTLCSAIVPERRGETFATAVHLALQHLCLVAVSRREARSASPTASTSGSAAEYRVNAEVRSHARGPRLEPNGSREEGTFATPSLHLRYTPSHSVGLDFSLHRRPEEEPRSARLGRSCEGWRSSCRRFA